MPIKWNDSGLLISTTIIYLSGQKNLALQCFAFQSHRSLDLLKKIRLICLTYSVYA